MGRTRNQLVVSSIPIAMRNLLFFIAVLTEDGKSTKKRSHLEKISISAFSVMFEKDSVSKHKRFSSVFGRNPFSPRFHFICFSLRRKKQKNSEVNSELLPNFEEK